MAFVTTALKSRAQPSNNIMAFAPPVVTNLKAVPRISAVPMAMGNAAAIPATETAATSSMLAKLKIMPAAKQYSHCRLPACCTSSMKLNPS